MTSRQGPRAIGPPGLAVKRALQLNGSTLDVAAYSCSGAVRLQALDLDAAMPAGAINGCPVQVTTRALRLTTKRTITVAVRCVNGCSGTLTLQTGDLALAAKLKAPTSRHGDGALLVLADGQLWKHRLNRPR